MATAYKCHGMEQVMTDIACRIMSTFPGEVRATDVKRGKEADTYTATVIATFGGFTRPYAMRVDGKNVSIKAVGPAMEV